MKKPKEKTRLMRLPKRITARFLRSIGACPGEVRRFQELWPNGAEFNYANVLKALRANLTPYYLLEEHLKQYGFITVNQWDRFEAAITHLDICTDSATYVDGKKAAVAKDKALIKEAKMSCALWKLAKPEVRVFKRED